MDNYSDYLLEFIAWRMAAGNKELADFRIYIRSEYAGSIGGAETVLRDVPAQPDAREREVSLDEQRKDGGVLIDTREGATPPKKKFFAKK